MFLPQITYFIQVQKYIFNCCSQNSSSTIADCAINKNQIDNNPKIDYNKDNGEQNQANKSSSNNKNDKEGGEGGGLGGFKRTKTRHFNN